MARMDHRTGRVTSKQTIKAIVFQQTVDRYSYIILEAKRTAPEALSKNGNDAKRRLKAAAILTSLIVLSVNSCKKWIKDHFLFLELNVDNRRRI